MPKNTRMRIFGAFKSKSEAKKAEKRHGAFIVVRKIKSHKRYIVVKER